MEGRGSVNQKITEVDSAQKDTCQPYSLEVSCWNTRHQRSGAWVFTLPLTCTMNLDKSLEISISLLFQVNEASDQMLSAVTFISKAEDIIHLLTFA